MGETRSFDRLHALARKGYRPMLGTDEAGDNAIRLTHIGRTPDLILHEDGRVEPVRDRLPRHKRSLAPIDDFGAEDAEEQVRFLRFVETVPKATLRDRTRRWRTRWVYGPLFLLTLWGVSLAFTAFIVENL